MKQNSSIIDEILVETNSFYGINNSFKDQDFLLFITGLHDLHLKATNLKAQIHFGKYISASTPASGFFENVIHPEDYSLFLETLTFPESAVPGEERQVQVRLITQEGQLEDFVFKGRPYRNEGFGKGKHLLIVARKLEPGETTVDETAPVLSKAFSALQNSQDKFRVLLNSIDEAFANLEIIFDFDGQAVDYLFVETNPAFEKHVQLHNPDGKTIRELLPDHQEHWLTTYGNVARTGEPVRFEGYSGKARNTWFDVYAFPIGEEENRKVGLIFSNITEKKLAEERLKKSNDSLERQVEERTGQLQENADLLQTVFDTTNQGILVLKPKYDPSGEIVDFQYLKLNKVMEQQHGQKGLEGKYFLEVDPNPQKKKLFETFREVMNHGELKDFEHFYDRGGKNQWFRIIVRSRNGLLIASAEDITQRKHEAQRLKETIRFKKMLSKASPDTIMIFDLQQENIQYINRDLSSHPGMSKREVVGKKITEIFSFVHPRDRENIRSFHQQVIRGSNEEVAKTEFRLRGSENKWEWYDALGKVFKRDSDGNVSQYLLMLRNIEEQKRTQKALLRAEKLSIKGEVARTLAHELRNPLASIGMAADVLQRSLPKDLKPNPENYLGIIRRGTQVLNNLVTDLLTSSNYTPPVLEKNCLAKILNDTLKLAGDRIYLTGIRVQRRYRGNYYINADAEKLKIALLNIIINASEAMDPNKGILRLKILKEDDYFILTIKDNGHGLEKDQLDKLFDAFYSQKADGVGVGLSSVKNILEEHEALIKVDSEPGKGTCFKLSFQCYEVFERN